MTELLHVEDPNEECGPGCPVWKKQMQEQNDDSVNYNPETATPDPSKVRESIAHEAHGLVHGERAKTYGHPRFDFTAIAKVWTGLLSDKLKPGEELDAYRVAVLMTGLKLCRLVKSPGHHDSRVDTIGYMLTMERLDEPEVETREAKFATGGPVSESKNSQDDSVPLPLTYSAYGHHRGFPPGAFQHTGEPVYVEKRDEIGEEMGQ